MTQVAMQGVFPPWLQSLRGTQIVRRVLDDPRSQGDSLLGLSADDAKEAAGWGQADFDSPWSGLSPDDRVLLYAYLFQPRHLEELTIAFRQILLNERLDDNPVVLDLGCGPCTGALALATVLKPNAPFDYVGVDRADAMRRLGSRLVSAAGQSPETAEIRCRWASGLAGVKWDGPPNWRTVIVIVSYLFASPTIDPQRLSKDLNEFLKRIGRGRVVILYTNSPMASRNRGFQEFADQLGQFGFTCRTDDIGRIESTRSDRSYELRYALFHRGPQYILERMERK